MWRSVDISVVCLAREEARLATSASPKRGDENATDMKIVCDGGKRERLPEKYFGIKLNNRIL